MKERCVHEHPPGDAPDPLRRHLTGQLANDGQWISGHRSRVRTRVIRVIDILKCQPVPRLYASRQIGIAAPDEDEITVDGVAIQPAGSIDPSVKAVIGTEE